MYWQLIMHTSDYGIRARKMLHNTFKEWNVFEGAVCASHMTDAGGHTCNGLGEYLSSISYRPLLFIIHTDILAMSRAYKKHTRRRQSWLNWKPRPQLRKASYTRALAAHQRSPTKACSVTPATFQKTFTSMQMWKTYGHACRTKPHRWAMTMQAWPPSSRISSSRGAAQHYD